MSYDMTVTSRIIEMRRRERLQFLDVVRSPAPASTINCQDCPLTVQRRGS